MAEKGDIIIPRLTEEEWKVLRRIQNDLDNTFEFVISFIFGVVTTIVLLFFGGKYLEQLLGKLFKYLPEHMAPFLGLVSVFAFVAVLACVCRFLFLYPRIRKKRENAYTLSLDPKFMRTVNKLVSVSEKDWEEVEQIQQIMTTFKPAGDFDRAISWGFRELPKSTTNQKRSERCVN